MPENLEVETDNTQKEVETDITPEEAETSQETQTEAPLTKEQKSKLDSFDRIYAENKVMKAKLKQTNPLEEKETSEEEVEEWEAPSDPLEVVKLGKVLKDYTEEETEFIIRNAPTKNIDGIINAEKDEMVQLAIKSKREKVAKEKALNPSTTQSETPIKPKTLEEALAACKTREEKEKILTEMGMNPLTIRNY